MLARVPGRSHRCDPPDFRLLAGGPGREHSRKLVAGGDVELAEDARQVAFDRAGGDEEFLRDLAVRQVPAGELRNAPLACRQRVEARQYDPSRSGPGCAQLRLGAHSERLRSRAVCDVEGFAQELP